MGGRGASSGVSVKGKPYGSEYHALFQVGNIKFVVPNEGATKAPMETMTKGRVYVTVDQMNEPKYITFYDKENKRFKQIDLKGKPHMIGGEKMLPHTHMGYEHDENGSFSVSPDEQKMIEKVKQLWYNRRGKK